MMVLEAQGLVMRYQGGDGSTLTVLDGVDLTVAAGEMVAIVGASGAGKSTLLHCIGALEVPTAGTVSIGGELVTARSDEALSAMRNRRIGFVFQFHHLLREFTARENVMMPLRIAGRSVREAGERADALLERVGLGARRTHRPSAMSGGEQQRCAVARALAAEPLVLIADEPSGNLDRQNAERLHDLFEQLAGDFGLAVVVATHNRSLAERASRMLVLSEGRLAPASAAEGVV
jgi:lipoprotein-releasing system ATP-binding protein